MENCLFTKLKETVDSENVQYRDALKIKVTLGNTADGKTLLLKGPYDFKIGGTGVVVKIISGSAHIEEYTTGGQTINRGQEYTLTAINGNSVYINAESNNQEVLFLLKGLSSILNINSFQTKSAANISFYNYCLATDIIEKLPYMTSATQLLNLVLKDDIISNLDDLASTPVNNVLLRFGKTTASTTYNKSNWVGNIKYLGKFIGIKRILFNYASLNGTVEELVNELRTNGAVSDSSNPIQLYLGYSGVKERISSTEGITWDGYKNLTWDANDFYLTNP